MVNQLPKWMVNGTFGELLVQIRLFQCGVQAVAPHKDTGNDLLATKGRVFHPVQIKTAEEDPFTFEFGELMDREWDILALVLIGEANPQAEDRVYVALDTCRAFFLRRDQVTKGYYSVAQLEEFEWSYEWISELFEADD